ncbi:hypothetical protein LC653_24765 [Nostoc sp. CHAB 5784]|uniref:hypothetical protein n=1 Tax=Nostoc mirabile TaxID=2907820 RepID=UPI001E4E24C5|nr:hypothetical protein [Nostoc mirabile]MCC5667013.1 hypothetical protein [Nostoc mirabile CHAB5784]
MSPSFGESATAKASTPDPEIEELIEEIDLEYITEDLPKVIYLINAPRNWSS